MPGKLSDHRKRVSLAEDIEVVEALKAIAAREGKTLTDLYAEAARWLLKERKTKTKK
jgi:hypothetical protein